MTEKAYASGSTCPPLAKDKLRLYSMRLCPYAQRTRLVLAHLNIPFEVVNVNLTQKPEWYFAKNPNGQVPTLEQGEKIVYESIVCNEYLEESHGGHVLLPADPYKKARIRVLMESVGKVTDKYYALLKLKTEEEKTKGIEELGKNVQIYENSIMGPYFFGDKPSMLDLHLWPWIERFPAMEKIVGKTLLPADQFPKLHTWIKTMLALPAVKTTMFSPEIHYEFYKPILSQQPINYDVGLS